MLGSDSSRSSDSGDCWRGLLELDWLLVDPAGWLAVAGFSLVAFVEFVVLLVADGDWAVMASSVGNIVAEMGLCGSGAARLDCCCGQLLCELWVVVQLLHVLCIVVVWSVRCCAFCSAELLVVVGTVAGGLAADVVGVAFVLEVVFRRRSPLFFSDNVPQRNSP